MSTHLQIFEHDFIFPATTAPAWSEKVDRWYQMDAFAFGICDCYSKFKAKLGPLPDFVLLASREASNRTDRLFVDGGSQSPSKFVHTLPNVRSAPLFQIAGWSGPCLCIQNDPATEVSGLREAAAIASVAPAANTSVETETVWMISIEALASSYRARFYVLSPDAVAEFVIEKTPLKATENSIFNASTDEKWLLWLGSKSRDRFRLSNSLQVIRCAPKAEPEGLRE